MMRYLVCVVLVALSTAAPRAQAVEQPATLTPEGASPLPLAAQAVRTQLLGQLDMYSIAVYADVPLRESVQLAAADTAKAMRIQIIYKDDLRRRIRLDWPRELVPALELAASASLRVRFASLQDGDVVLIEYTPSRGTTVRVGNTVAVASAPHDLMLSFLDHWIGQRPLSEDIKRALLSSSSQ
jgi:hypothetical protein